MNLTTKQIQSIQMALSERARTLSELVDNTVIDTISTTWKQEIRDELAGMPALQKMVLDAWIDSFKG